METCKGCAHKLYDKVSSRIRNCLTTHTAERVNKLIILPKMEYCDFVWNDLVSSRLDELACICRLGQRK